MGPSLSFFQPLEKGVQCYIFADYLAIIKTNLSYRNIIFDLGGVLVDLAPEKMLQSIAGISDFSVSSLKEAADIDLFKEFELGQITTEVFLNQFKNDYNSMSSHKELADAFNLMIAKVPEDGIELLKSIQHKYQLFLLSNTNPIHIEEINRRIDFKFGIKGLSGLFNKTYLSYNLNMVKPDVSIYNYVLEDARINPSETLFIDDMESNLTGAESVGINVLHAAQPKIWQDYLNEL